MRLAVSVPLERAEEARARAIELSPAGFGERRGAEEVELAFNTLLGAVQRVLARVDAARAVTSGYRVGERPCAPGWIWSRGGEAGGWAAGVFVRDSGFRSAAPAV